MTEETENSRVFDDKKILVVSFVFSISHYMLHLFGDGVQTFMELPGAITKCSGRSTNGFPWIVVVKLLYNLAVILTGIAMDHALNR